MLENANVLAKEPTHIEEAKKLSYELFERFTPDVQIQFLRTLKNQLLELNEIKNKELMAELEFKISITNEMRNL
jgi:hypothetical protein